jgi:hypothetical protein
VDSCPETNLGVTPLSVSKKFEFIASSSTTPHQLSNPKILFDLFD